MPLLPPRARNIPPRPGRDTGPVLAVGGRALVASPSNAAPLTDETGHRPAGSLSDGSTVEILAWRPRGAGGTRYKVRSTDGTEGWLAADRLRAIPRPVTPARLPPTPVPSARPAPKKRRS